MKRHRGNVFTPKDFLDLGSRAAVDQALSRLARSGTIRRLRRGLYDYPKVSPRLGALSAVPADVAKAIARTTKSRVWAGGAQAANALGLSTQVAARPVFATDGPSRRVTFGRQTVVLRHVSSKYVVKDLGATLAIQALRHLGPRVIDQTHIAALVNGLSPKSKSALGDAIGQVPDWMVPVIRQVVGASKPAAA